MGERLQFIIMAGFALLCFGCRYLTAFIVTRKNWRGDMINRGFANYNERTASAPNLLKVPFLRRTF